MGGDRSRRRVRARDGAGSRSARSRLPRGTPRSRRDALGTPESRRPQSPGRAARDDGGWRVRRGRCRRPRRGGRRPVADRLDAQRVLGDRDRRLRTESRLRAGAGRHRPRHHVRRHGRHQHGPRRADDARGLYDLRRSTVDAGPDRRLPPRGGAGRVPGRRRGGRAHRTDRHQVPLRAAARDPPRDVRRKPRAAAARALGVLREQPRGRHAGVDERDAAVQRGVLADLEPPVHRPVRDGRLRARAGGPALHAPGARHPRGVAEPHDGTGHGRADRVGRRADVRTRRRDCRRGRGGPDPTDQRRPEPRPVLHRGLVHGRGVRRRRQSVGHAHRGHVARHRHQAARAVRRRRARQDSGADRPDPLHPASSAGTVSTDGPGREGA